MPFEKRGGKSLDGRRKLWLRKCRFLFFPAEPPRLRRVRLFVGFKESRGQQTTHDITCSR